MENELSELPRGRVLWLLFFNFFKIALFVVGGGYAIILAAEDIFIRKLHWLRDGELMDMLAIIQTIPGLMAGNAAIYVGYRASGALGALVALIGVAMPSFLIITAVAMGFSHLPMDNIYVQGAFIGVRSALGGLVLAALLRTWKKMMTVCLCDCVRLFRGRHFRQSEPRVASSGSDGGGNRLPQIHMQEDHGSGSCGRE